MNTNSTEADLRTEMNRLGAREFEIVALSMDAERGLAALVYAQSKGAENPIPYAIKMFDSPDWTPSPASKRLVTNASVEVKCAACGGDRFITVTDDPVLYGETYAPCAACNSAANTVYYRVDGTLVKTPAR